MGKKKVPFKMSTDGNPYFPQKLKYINGWVSSKSIRTLSNLYEILDIPLSVFQASSYQYRVSSTPHCIGNFKPDR